MRTIIVALTAIMFVSSPVNGQKSDSASSNVEAIERLYCTQFGPFFLRFDPDKAAGVFAINPNNDLGAVVGAIEDRTLTGEWIEVDSKGAIRIAFSEDWSSFEAAYTVGVDSTEWLEGWFGYLPPAGDPDEFEIAGETFHCR